MLAERGLDLDELLQGSRGCSSVTFLTSFSWTYPLLEKQRQREGSYQHGMTDAATMMMSTLKPAMVEQGGAKPQFSWQVCQNVGEAEGPFL